MANVINLAINAKDNATRVVAGLNRSLVALNSTISRTTQSAKTMSSSFSSSMSGAAGSVSRISSSMSGLSSQIKGVAGSMSMLSAGLGAIAGKSVSVGIDFEDNIQKLKSTIFTVTDADMSKLEAQARELGKTTKFTAGQAAQAQTFLAQAGWTTKQIMNAMEGTLGMAASSGMALERSAEVISKISNAFKMPASDAMKVADILALTASKTNVNLEELSETMKYAAPIAKEFGLSLEQASALAGKMGDIGIAGSEAGTAMRAGLTRLAAPPKMARRWFEKLGVSVIDTRGNMRKMGDIIQELEGKVGNLNKSQKIDALSKIFGLEAVSGWAGVLGQGSGVYGKLVNALENSNGVAIAKAKIMEDSLGGALRELQSQAEDVGITITQLLNPSIMKMIHFAESAMNAFDKMSTSAKKSALAYAGIAAAIGPVLMIMGALVGSLAMLLSPLGLVASGFAFVTASMLVAGVKSNKFRDRVKDVFNTLRKEVFGSSVSTRQALDMLTRFMVKVAFKVLDITESAILGASSFWKAHGNTIKSVLSVVVGAVGGFISGGLKLFMIVTRVVMRVASGLWSRFGDDVMNALGKVSDLINKFSSMSVGDMRKAFGDMVSSVKTHFVPVLSVAALAIEGFVSVGKGLWQKHGDDVKSILTSLMNIVKPIFTSLFTNVLSLASTFVIAIEKLLRENGSTIAGIFDFAFSMIAEVVAAAMPLITDILKSAFDFIDSVFVKNKDTWIDIVTTLVTGVLGLFKYLVDTILPIIEPALQTMLDFWNNNKDEIIDVVSYLVGFIKNLFETGLGAVVEVVTTVLGGIFTLFTENKDVIIPVVTELMTLLSTIFTEGLALVVELVSYAVQGILDFFHKNKDDILLVVEDLTTTISALWEFLGPALKVIVKFAFDIVVGIIQSAFDIIAGLTKVFKGIFTGDWKMALDGALQFIKGFILTAITFFAGPLFKVLGKISGSGLTKLVSLFGGKFGTIVDKMKSVFGGIFGWLSKAFKTSISFVEKMISRSVKNLNKMIKVMNYIPGIKMKPIQFKMSDEVKKAAAKKATQGGGIVVGGAASAVLNRKPPTDPGLVHSRVQSKTALKKLNLNGDVNLDGYKVGSFMGQHIANQSQLRAGF